MLCVVFGGAVEGALVFDYFAFGLPLTVVMCCVLKRNRFIVSALRVYLLSCRKRC